MSLERRLLPDHTSTGTKENPEAERPEGNNYKRRVVRTPGVGYGGVRGRTYIRHRAKDERA